MTATASDTGGRDFQKVPQGTHLAICNMVINLGPQPTSYQGQDTGLKSQVYIRWEIPSERVEPYEFEGKTIEGPMTIGKTYTLSLSEKANLRHDLESWRNKSFTEDELAGFDVDKILGVCCQIIVTHKESERGVNARVTGVAGWPKGLDRIKAENDLISYAQDNTAQHERLPKWIKEKVGLPGQVPPPTAQSTDDFEDDIPF